MIATIMREADARVDMQDVAESSDPRRPTSYHFEYRPITDLASVVINIKRVRPFERALDLNNRDREEQELVKNVSPGAEVVYAVNDDEPNEDLGVYVHRRKTITLEGKTLSFDLVALRYVYRYARRLGISKDFTLDTMRRADEEEEQLDGFSGRIPNPLIMKGYRHTPGIGLILPLDRLYTHQMQGFMIAFLSPDVEDIRFRTGRCIRAYPPGENRLVTLDPSDEEAWAIRERMVTPEEEGGLGISLKEGDGMRYVVFRKKTPRGRTRWENLPLGLNGAA